MKTDFEIKLRDYKPQRIASIRAKTTIDKVTSKVSQLLQETSDYLDGLGVSPAGAGLAVYYEVGSFLVDVEVGFPIIVEVPGNDRVQQNDLPGGKCAVALFQGPPADIASEIGRNSSNAIAAVAISWAPIKPTVLPMPRLLVRANQYSTKTPNTISPA